jgi:hypothetical protein
MKKFLSLINFSIESNRRWNKDSLYTLKYWALFIFFFASWMVFVSNSTGEIPFTEILVYLFTIMTAVVSVLYGVKPSMLHLVPVSYKRRVIYYYASILIYSLVALATIFIFMMIFIVPIGIAVYFTEGDAFLLEVFDFSLPFGANVYLFSAFKALFTLSFLSVVARMERKKSFIISFAALVITHFAGAFVLSVLVDRANGFVLSSNIYPYFDTLPNPTLAVILCGVFAVVAFALSFIFIVRQEKPKAF